MNTDVGTLIYLGVMPLIKTFIAIIFGYLLARMGLFPAAASKGASRVTMSVALPGLIFSSIVPAFTPSNVSAIGPLILLAFVYQMIGFLLGHFIREICYVPRNFYQGLVVMCATSNWGNLPTAVVLSVTQTAPFDPTKDPALGVSFVSIFVLAYILAFWVFGGAHSISWDYLPGVPQGEAAEKHVSWKEKPIGGWIARHFFAYTPELMPNTTAYELKKKTNILEGDVDLEIADVGITECLPKKHPEPTNENPMEISSSDASIPSSNFNKRHHQLNDQHTATFRTPVSKGFREQGQESSVSINNQIQSSAATNVQVYSSRRILFLLRLRRIMKPLMDPIAITIIISLPIALVKPLKALFVDTRAVGGPNWHGPDGRPPLFFIIDSASFLGSMTVPMALIILGASFAHLKIPRPFLRLPFAAMISVALSKMVIMPVIGILIVRAMVGSGFIPKENKVEQFVAMFLSGTPAAVNQLIATQLYAPDGNVDTLSAFLLVQYIFMFFGSAALTAISLSLL